LREGPGGDTSWLSYTDFESFLPEMEGNPG